MYRRADRRRTWTGETYIVEVYVVPVELRVVFFVEPHPPEAVVFAQICGVQLVLEPIQDLQECSTGGHSCDNVVIHGTTSVLQQFLHIRCTWHDQ